MTVCAVVFGSDRGRPVSRSVCAQVMALLHLKLLGLRNKGIRTLSATLMVLVFFTGVFLLVLHPARYPITPSVSPLSADLKDVAVRALPSSSPDPDTEEKGNNSSPESDSREEGGPGTGENSHSNVETAERKSIIAGGAEVATVKLTNDDGVREMHVHQETIPTTVKDRLEPEKTDSDLQPDSKQQNEIRSPQKVSSQPDSSPDSSKVPPPPPSSRSQTSPHLSQPSNPPQPGPVDPAHPDRQPPGNKADPGPPSSLPPFQILGSNLEILPFRSFPSPFIDTERKRAGRVDKKVITWYRSPELGDSGLRKAQNEVNQKRRLLKNCPEAKCRLVYPLPKGQRADAVVFSDVDASVAPPARSHADQVYVFRKMSPPSSPHQVTWPAAWRWTFNWTWSYRRDSTIWQPLGLLRAADSAPPLDHFLALAQGKTRAVAWIPRTCPLTAKTPSKRNEFVEELRRYVHVSDFGSCSSRICAKENASCSEVLSQDFFFLLALEDGLCKDYVTEVFYRAWQEGTYVLPVVRGGANYAAYFPQGTYINADWFDSVKQLYDFLSDLMADRRLYAQLLWRKSHWVKGKRKTEEMALCHLCYKLHHVDTTPRTYLDLRRWSERSVCKVPT